MKRLLCLLTMVSLLPFVSASSDETTYAYNEHLVYCIADKLNGRASPNRHSKIEFYAEYGDAVSITGNRCGDWWEAYGGETGTVWLHGDYLSETVEPYKAKNISGGRVWVRKAPSEDAKKVDYIPSGKLVTIKRTMDGWGYTGRGWVLLTYFSDIDIVD